MAVKVKVTQLCLTLCDSMDYKVHGILQARILEWVAFPFSRDLPNPWIKPRSPAFQADSLPTKPLMAVGRGKISVYGTNFSLYFFAKNTSLNNSSTKKLGEDFSEHCSIELKGKRSFKNE